MQLAIIEYCRNVLKMKNVGSSEFGKFKNNVVSLMKEWTNKKLIVKRNEKADLGGSMRLGAYPCFISKQTLAYNIYKKTQINERHRHRYEINPKFKNKIEKNGLVFSGISKDKNLLEIIENKNDPWFLAVQFHPELKSKPFKPHPIFLSFIKSCNKKNNEQKN